VGLVLLSLKVVSPNWDRILLLVPKAGQFGCRSHQAVEGQLSRQSILRHRRHHRMNQSHTDSEASANDDHEILSN
jgi:hypothetical protein